MDNTRFFVSNKPMALNFVQMLFDCLSVFRGHFWSALHTGRSCFKFIVVLRTPSYTLHQKKVFFIDFSWWAEVRVSDPGSFSVRVSDPGAPGQIERLNVTFFRWRVYIWCCVIWLLHIRWNMSMLVFGFTRRQTKVKCDHMYRLCGDRNLSYIKSKPIQGSGAIMVYKHNLGQL